MSTQTQISAYLSSIPHPKQAEMQQLHETILQLMPNTRLWFLDGKDENNKTVSNPNIGYGSYNMNQAGGKAKEFYQIGISANTAGISVYIMGIKDRNYLPQAYSKKIGKATVTGYCIKFKSLKDIDLEVLKEAINFRLQQTGQ